ncbi:MAG: 2-amino-4-hydroxy-6-hydroxymethyldihydropteridine diphosphokinase [Sphingomonadales bacterium]
MGANLRSKDYGAPQETLEAALGIMTAKGLCVTARSRWYRSEPVPLVDADGLPNPWYVNGVIAVETSLDPRSLLHVLGEIERDMGRVRGRRWESRIVDLDLLAYRDRIIGTHWLAAGAIESTKTEADIEITVPHPHLHERSFVLLPLREIAPNWVHPATGDPIDRLIASLKAASAATPIEPE